ncbi:hypothetical protein BDV97DRAFT_354429 [Delphinella strobiligena]|nr:hypothetical protein BDV97DRAFT_354429 [Delphinella strobiligena]
MNNVFFFRKLPKDPTLSNFEQLPTEIVQEIFEYSNNINLPLSSMIFSSQLSAESIYARFAADQLYAEDCGAFSGQVCSSAAAISRMLQCRWMSWRIFKAALQGCFARAERAARNRNRDTNDNEMNGGDDPDSDREELQSVQPTPTASASPDQEMVLLPLPPLFEEPFEERRYYHLHTPIQLPDKLLRGPWTPDKMHFLYYLVWNDVGIDWSLSSRGEVATRGLQSAIEQRNRKVVATLVSPVVGVVPSAANVKSAVVDYGCDQTIVFHLIQAVLRAKITERTTGETMTDVDFRDASLWHWARRVKEAGNGKGDWLTDVLRYTEDARLMNSSYDETTHDDFVRACAREEDGVEAVRVPLKLHNNDGQRRTENEPA